MDEIATGKKKLTEKIYMWMMLGKGSVAKQTPHHGTSYP
jgi:hypothetical protein